MGRETAQVRRIGWALALNNNESNIAMFVFLLRGETWRGQSLKLTYAEHTTQSLPVKFNAASFWMVRV